MPVYVFAKVQNISDHSLYKKYAEENSKIVKKFGGKFLYRNNQRELIEGNQIDDRLVILEFDTKEDAKNWYYSQEYQQARNIRKEIADASIYILDQFNQ
jgi:uncharacterized protein (DUF1330 family)